MPELPSYRHAQKQFLAKSSAMRSVVGVIRVDTQSRPLFFHPVGIAWASLMRQIRCTTTGKHQKAGGPWLHKTLRD